MTRAGPPLELKDAVAKFRKAHKRTFLSNHRVMAEVKRQWRTPEEAICAASNDEYARQRGIKLSILCQEEAHG
jgi:hypothetical protein